MTKRNPVSSPRLPFAHVVAVLLEPAGYKVTQAQEKSHFRGCAFCQAFNAVYLSLDPADPRFLDWVHILDEVGALNALAQYEITRYADPSLRSFLGWQKANAPVGGWASKMAAAMAYEGAVRRDQAVTGLEFGHDVWDNPAGVTKITLVQAE